MNGEMGGIVALAMVAILAISGMLWGIGGTGGGHDLEEAEPTGLPVISQAHGQRDIPLAVLMNLWFGFDLESGHSIGGLKSSHWNLDVGGSGSRVGVTYKPEYGFYASDDPAVIRQQLSDMEKAGISVIIAGWHGTGDRNLDGIDGDDREMEAIDRALTALLREIEQTKSPVRVAVLVEPFMFNLPKRLVGPGGDPNPPFTPEKQQGVLDGLWDNIYEPYLDLMFEWDGPPLVVTWGPANLKDPNDARFSVRSFGSERSPSWKTVTGQDWNWYPDVSLLPSMISDDGMFVVFPRFDEHWMAIMGQPFARPVRTVDPLFKERVYEQVWQAAVDNRAKIDLLVLYHWNEHQEHSAIEPDMGVAVTGYGRTLVEKTARYYSQFLAGESIEITPPDQSGVWSTPSKIKQYIGSLDAPELGLEPGVSVDSFLGERLREAQSLIESRLDRGYSPFDLPAGLRNIHLRLTSNIYNYIPMNKRNPVMQIGEFNPKEPTR